MHFLLILNKLWDSLCLNAWFLKYSSRCHRQLVSVIFQLMEKPLSNLIFFPSAGKLQIKTFLPNKWQKDYLNAGYLISLLALPPLSSTVSLAVALNFTKFIKLMAVLILLYYFLFNHNSTVNFQSQRIYCFSFFEAYFKQESFSLMRITHMLTVASCAQ